MGTVEGVDRDWDLTPLRTVSGVGGPGEESDRPETVETKVLEDLGPPTRPDPTFRSPSARGSSTEGTGMWRRGVGLGPGVTCRRDTRALVSGRPLPPRTLLVDDPVTFPVAVYVVGVPWVPLGFFRGRSSVDVL